ncbi:Flavin-dependent tryptophan halogenase PrnA [Thalassocella blandensis]|nr:Flavin-dependent tryptophan halogenase PrnA [Thalassocella blandensis]
MQPERITSIVIVGGGTAGWISAAILAKLLPSTACKITLIESSEIATVGVGEATIPPIIELLRYLEIDEQDFICKTEATFKLGILFKDWLTPGSNYFHPFGSVGVGINKVSFFHYWQIIRAQFPDTQFADFSPAAAMANAGKFIPPAMSGEDSLLRGANYALHFDANLVAKYLQTYSLAKGVERRQATINSVHQNDKGFIQQLTLHNGETIAGDLFLDCSGFTGLLIEKTLHAGYENWQKYLPCDSAVTVLSQKSEKTPPYTVATAKAAGWQWQIPLQHRMGNGYVYCSKDCEDSDAQHLLLNSLATPAISEARKLTFTTGYRKIMWKHNCIAVGLSAGFLEPLESTGIHLIMRAVKKLVELLPNKNCDPALADEFNRTMIAEYEAIRDFLVLHYVTTQRSDSPFWRRCSSMDIPESLARKIAIFLDQGKIAFNPHDLFMEQNWHAIFEGMNVRPNSVDWFADFTPESEALNIARQLQHLLHKIVGTLPSHDNFLTQVRGNNIRSTKLPQAS